MREHADEHTVVCSQNNPKKLMKLKTKGYLFDAHAHINFNAFKDDADEVIKRSLETGVFMINVGSQYETSKRAVEYAKKYEGVFAAIGLHPIHVSLTPTLSLNRERGQGREGEEFDFQKYLELARNPKVVAIGEMGLDYYHIEKGSGVEKVKDKQKQVFLEGIKLSNAVQKPMIIHCREAPQNSRRIAGQAYDDLLEILKDNPIYKKGVIHCFVGNLKTAKEFISLGYKIGLNGIITYSESYDRLIKEISINDILLETDCPYLTPRPLSKNERNEPANVKYVAEKISHLKNTSIKEVKMATTRNAKEVFGIC